MVSSRSGYTLPVFACAAAVAALQKLQQSDDAPVFTAVSVDLLKPAETVKIPIEQVANLHAKAALAISRSDPGDNVDLTRHTPIWALVEWAESSQSEPIRLIGGEGIGRQVDRDGQAAIYTYARELLQSNLSRMLHPDQKIQVTLILPEGRKLAERTSNAAFGIVEGLSLLGTSGISEPLSAPAQLQAYREVLQQKSKHDCLVFCIGENGLSRAAQLGIDPDRLVKTANWLGPLLVEAGLQEVKSILLFGYHGKLLKLAGGIFHTHHYVADARQEIFTAYCAKVGLPNPELQTIFSSPTIEAGLQHLTQLDQMTGSQWVPQIYREIAAQIDRRCQEYIWAHAEQSVEVGSILFDRSRQIIVQSVTGDALLRKIC